MSTLNLDTARVFKPLLRSARYKGAHGGRGSGKSHFFAELVVERCLLFSGTRIVCVREVQKSLKESVKLLVEDKIAAHGVASMFRITNDSIVTPGDGRMLFQGMRDHTAESIKSLEGFDVAYVEEAQTLTQRSLEFLRPTIRKANSELWFSWNPRHTSDPVDHLLRGPELPPDAVVVETNYMDNPFFPAVLEEERAFDQRTKPDRYRHIWLGEYQPMALGAIWSMAVINEHRRSPERVPAYKRIVVSIDPAGSSEETANETGIVVCGLGEDGRGYVIDDVSLHGQPAQWAERALAVYDLYEADAIVVETNYGGNMVRNTVHAVRPLVRVIEVRAHRGQKKHIRAEPISALYALGKISHVGAYPKLEAQMCLVTAGGWEGEGSPDRMDAMVYAFTELFPKLTKKTNTKRRPTRADSSYSPHRWRR